MPIPFLLSCAGHDQNHEGGISVTISAGNLEFHVPESHLACLCQPVVRSTPVSPTFPVPQAPKNTPGKKYCSTWHVLLCPDRISVYPVAGIP